MSHRRSRTRKKFELANGYMHTMAHSTPDTASCPKYVAAHEDQ